jgi:hypothetical protein
MKLKTITPEAAPTMTTIPIIMCSRRDRSTELQRETAGNSNHVLAESFLRPSRFYTALSAEQAVQQHFPSSLTCKESSTKPIYHNIISQFYLSALLSKSLALVDPGSLIRHSFLSTCRLSPCQIPSSLHLPHYLRLCARLLLRQVD